MPSSLLLGVTTYITTDIAAVPLLWVLPLAIYLLTFILAFGRWPARAPRAVVAVDRCPLVLVVLFLMVSALPPRIWVTRALAPRRCSSWSRWPATASWPSTARRRAT